MEEKIIVNEVQEKTKGGDVTIYEGVPRAFKERPTMVTFGLGATINAGNFESVRVDFKLSVPCENDDASLDRVTEEVIERVKNELLNEVTIIRDSKEKDTGLSFEN